jgi:hypothetical protein
LTDEGKSFYKFHFGRYLTLDKGKINRITTSAGKLSYNTFLSFSRHHLEFINFIYMYRVCDDSRFSFTGKKTRGILAKDSEEFVI